MMATPSKIVVPAVVVLALALGVVGVNAKPYGGSGYYGKYGGSKYGGVSDSYGKYGGVSDSSYDDGYYKGSKYGGYGYNAPKPKVSWWKPWSWKYAKKSYSYSYGDEYEYGHDNDLTKADLREAAHAYVGLSETLKVDVFRALPMTPATTTTTTLTTNRTTNAPFVIEMTDPNEFECTCGSNVGNLAFACISFLFDKDGNEIPPPQVGELSAIQNVYQSFFIPVIFLPILAQRNGVNPRIFSGYPNQFIGTSQSIFFNFNRNFSQPIPGQVPIQATTRRQGSILPHNPGGERIYDYSVELRGLTVAFGGKRVQKQGEVTCRGPQAVIEACSTRCDRAVEEKLLTKNEFAQKCLP